MSTFSAVEVALYSQDGSWNTSCHPSPLKQEVLSSGSGLFYLKQEKYFLAVTVPHNITSKEVMLNKKRENAITLEKTLLEWIKIFLITVFIIRF